MRNVLLLCVTLPEAKHVFEQMKTLMPTAETRKANLEITIDRSLIMIRSIKQVKYLDGIQFDDVILSTGMMRTGRIYLNEAIDLSRLLMCKTGRIGEW